MNERLANEKISKLLLSLAIPSILAQMVTLLYNLVDRIYIGRMEDGALAIAGIGLCSAIITIIIAFTNLFGRGGAPLASISLGADENDQANKIISNCFSSLVLSSIVIMIVLYILGEEILLLFGASANTLSYAKDYLNIYLLGTIFVQLSVGMNYFINCQGYAKFGMLTLVIGGALNIILDPIFIFTLNMGVAGAALATIISQFVSFLWVMHFIFSKRSTIKIKKEYLFFDKIIMKRVLGLGISPFFMNSTEGILQVCFNRQLLFFGGDIAVSSMTIMASMAQIVFLPMVIKVALTFSVIMVTLMELFPALFVSMFTNDPELMELGVKMLRVYIFGYIIGANSSFQQIYTSLGEGKRSFFFAFYRKIILLIPLIYILPNFISNGVLAVMLAEPVSDLLTTGTNAIFFKRFINDKLK